VHEHVDGSDVHFGQDHDSQLIDFDDANVPAILIVDDNPELRAFLNYRLQGSYRILEAGNGVEGLKLAKSELPDIIVTDVMMPKMTGLEMTSALRADPDTDFIPILMLSARTTRRDTVAGLQQGADDYLAKPFDSAELAARVAGLIASRRKLQARMQIQDEADKRQSVFLENAAGIAHKHLAEADFGPRDWAALLHMDRTTLYRKLKAETGLSPEEYLREQRLLLAADLLKTKAGNVSQVAVSVGFNSISYFSTRFKERFGLTPAAYTRN
jgi:DNA-binding response OmpR family regulator